MSAESLSIWLVSPYDSGSHHVWAQGFLAHTRHQITMLTSYGAAPLDITVAIQLLQNRRVPVLDMITHRLPLSETAHGFRLVEEAGKSIKVIMEPQK